jgi:ABC-type bacteriocin/lantibiotic exporter with double-glycine peptidase domain
MFITPTPIIFSSSTVVESRTLHIAALSSSTPNDTAVATSTIPVVPFYSQFVDIASAKWKKVGCGITSLAMVIAYYKPDVASVETLLKEGIALGAFDAQAGWSHQGLIHVSQKYGMDGESYNLGGKSSAVALAKFMGYLKDGPVIASIHYKFDPKNPIPHLVVVNAIEDGIVYYNDPAAKEGAKTISLAQFTRSWKQKFIVVRPEVA